MRILVAGAKGEVGRSVSSALTAEGHAVTGMSARAPLPGDPDVLSVAQACALVRGGAFDAVVNASGRGDRRSTDRTGREATSALAAAGAVTGIPTILLSTTRVTEGQEGAFREDWPARPLTPYALANAANEEEWLTSGGSTVLRMANFLCEPSGVDSPQTALLPWSLLREGARERSIRIRSGAQHAKEFVSARDVASAVDLLVSRPSRPAIVATVPGVVFSMVTLANACVHALKAIGIADVVVTYGPDSADAPASHHGWLAGQGWRSLLDDTQLAAMVTGWTAEHRTQLISG